MKSMMTVPAPHRRRLRDQVDTAVETASAAPVVDIVIPVYNEAVGLLTQVERLVDYLNETFPFTYRVTIADNASTDATWDIACRLEAANEHVVALHLEERGRGRALRAAWSNSDSAVLAYMDVDLSTDLDALLPLVAPLVSGHSDVAIGSRLSAGSSVARRPKREFISRSYNAMLRTMFATQIRDAQCGFKAVRHDVAQRLLPSIQDNEWFFDTELLLIAERNGLRIHQVPVDWVDDPDSRVQITQTAFDDVRGALRVATSFARGGGRVNLSDIARDPLVDDFGRRIVSFALIGTLSTGVSLALFLSLRDPVGAIGANAIAVSATFALNAYANARYTFRAGRRTWRPAFIAYVGTLVGATAVLAATRAAGASRVVEVLVLCAVWAVAAVARLALVAKNRRPTSVDPTL